jgi:hypothetical protein
MSHQARGRQDFGFEKIFGSNATAISGHLRLWSTERVALPNSFLGGFAPRLEVVNFFHLPFSGLPKLLLSATHFVDLRLYDIPHPGYISPDAMVAALSTLPSLKYLSIGFKSPESCPDLETRRLPPSTRSVLPALKSFAFKGASEYLEDLVTDIDALQLNKLEITFFNDIVFDTPQLIQFISRTPVSSALALENAHIALKDDNGATPASSSDHTHMPVASYSTCQSSVKDWFGSCHLWRRSVVPRACLSFPRWKTSTSTRTQNGNQIGKATSRIGYGWNYYTHLSL